MAMFKNWRCVIALAFATFVCGTKHASAQIYSAYSPVIVPAPIVTPVAPVVTTYRPVVPTYVAPTTVYSPIVSTTVVARPVLRFQRRQFL